jgi:hypothetical protein
MLSKFFSQLELFFAIFTICKSLAVIFIFVSFSLGFIVKILWARMTRPYIVMFHQVGIEIKSIFNIHHIAAILIAILAKS